MYLAPSSYNILRIPRLLPMACPDSTPIMLAILFAWNASSIPAAVVTKDKSFGYAATKRRITSICSKNNWTASLYCESHPLYADQNYAEEKVQ